MIQANELRIGNLVYNCHGDIHAIGCNCFHRFRYPSMDGNPSGFNPIPLTEEVLLKCGFNIVPETLNYYYKGQIVGLFEVICGKVQYTIDSNVVCEMEYLHQLQNLFYAVTGKELEVSL